MNQLEINRNALVEYVRSQGWKHRIDVDNEEHCVIQLGMNVRGKLSSVRMILVASESDIQSIAVCPMNATEDVRQIVAEYVTRANYGLKVGNFELDFRDGEVRYQSCMVSLDGVPTQKNIERTVDMPILMFSRYGDGLVKSLMGFGNPEQDIREIEG